MEGKSFGVHIFQDDMSYGSICLKGGHALLEEIYYRRSCIGRVPVFRMAFLTGLCILLENLSYRRTGLL